MILVEVAADFDGDTHIDLAVPGAEVFIHLGDGTGMFTEVDSLPPPGSMGDFPIAVGDLNEDQTLDLAVSSRENVFGFVSIFFGNGNGTFSFQNTFQSPKFSQILLADWNEDGHLDLVGRNPGLLYFEGDGTGNFGPQNTLSTGIGGSVVAADLNGDLHLDILSLSSGRFRLFAGDGTGAFAEEVLFERQPLKNRGFVAADLDEDGILDVITTKRNRLETFLSRRSGGFEHHKLLTTPRDRVFDPR